MGPPLPAAPQAAVPFDHALARGDAARPAAPARGGAARRRGREARSWPEERARESGVKRWASSAMEERGEGDGAEVKKERKNLMCGSHQLVVGI